MLVHQRHAQLVHVHRAAHRLHGTHSPPSPHHSPTGRYVTAITRDAAGFVKRARAAGVAVFASWDTAQDLQEEAEQVSDRS
ncbi:hypothetical protein GCM10027174_06750 [Salinifilum aidingensis]